MIRTLHELNTKLMAAESMEEIAGLTIDCIKNHIGVSAAFYSGDYTKTESNIFYKPIISKGMALGALGVPCANGNRLSQENELFLDMIASQAAMAMELRILADERANVLADLEKEKMRSNLLFAISHDIKTPLAAISGTSSFLLEQCGFLDKQTTKKMLSDIMDESQWLTRMVENLLLVTRVNQKDIQLAKEPEAAEEIIAASVRRVKNRFPDKKIRVNVPDELLLVPMDGILISQVIINLLENAIKYSGDSASIEVNVIKKKDYALFDVIDDGIGISEHDLRELFKAKNYGERRRSDFAGGLGMGLSVCESIVNAHGGTIEAFAGKEGGAVFRFSLPL